MTAVAEPNLISGTGKYMSVVGLNDSFIFLLLLPVSLADKRLDQSCSQIVTFNLRN